jgi:dephospho-CoA kinase
LRDGNIIIPDWIITDVRFPNEFKAIKERNGMLIKVIRDTGKVSAHISETALDYENRWDCVIDNNGTIEELKVKVEEAWNTLVIGQEKKVPV